MTLKGRIRAVVDLLLPRLCPCCGRELYILEEHLCADCIQGMPLTYFWTQNRNPMADKYNEGIQRLLTGSDHAGWEPYGNACALFFYRGDYKSLTQKVKYDADIALGKYLGNALGRKLLLGREYDDIDLIIPVPLHWLRKLRRGYNQSEVIARAVKETFDRLGSRNTVVRTDLLHRTRRTGSQVTMHGDEKKRNISGAFEGCFDHCDTAPVHILLIDDVFTSGSTLAECQHSLRLSLVRKFGEKKAAKIKISAASLAYVGD